MFQWLRNLWQAKVQINIIYPAPGGVSTTTPRIVSKEGGNISKVRKSDLRFVEYDITEADGQRKVYYYTEVYSGRSWAQANGTWFADKNRAMEAHLQLIERGTLDPVKIQTVLWEGLSKEETQTWVNIQLTKENTSE